MFNRKEYQRNYHKIYYKKNKEKILRHDREYRRNNREKRSKLHKEYYLKHKEKHIIQESKRRGLGCFILLNNPFPPEVKVDYHHMNNLIVIPIPSKLHNNNSQDINKHRERCNEIIEKLYIINLNELLKE